MIGNTAVEIKKEKGKPEKIEGEIIIEVKEYHEQ